MRLFVQVAWRSMVVVCPRDELSTILKKSTNEYVYVAIFGPIATNWFKFLQNKVVLKNKNLEMAARVAADQCIVAPINLGLFLTTMSVLEGTDPKKKLEANYSTALQKNYMIWPAVQAVNFKLVPLEHRVLVVNIVSLGWNCYLSYLNGRNSDVTVEKVVEKVKEL